VAHDLKQLAVKHAELLAQDLAGNRQRFDDRGQVRWSVPWLRSRD
jgi:hypothetical protein